MNLEVGSFKQKASQGLVYFVFSCILITTSILYVWEKSEEKALTLNSISLNSSYYPF